MTSISIIVSFFVIFLNVSLIDCRSKCKPRPEQIHLSLGAKPSEMVVTWVTMCPSKEAKVLFGTTLFDKTSDASVTKFRDAGKKAKIIFIYRAFLTELIPGQKYYYYCQNDKKQSFIYSFKTLKNGSDWTPRFAVFGDLGLINGRSIPSLIEDVTDYKYDFVIHNGDIAYDMHSKNGKVGNEFMREIEAIAAKVPYLTTPGNHEEAYNFSHYENRFTMIDSNTSTINNHYYSFNAGLVHVICFSTEFYYSKYFDEYHIRKQYEWLKNDLIEANKQENRKLRPWIITIGHQPMYCTMKNVEDNHDCTNKQSQVRKGIRTTQKYGLEDLFYNYGVDLELWAHEHSFERLWPVYDGYVFNGSLQEPYTNPRAPVHLISGFAGNHKGFDSFSENTEDWSALRVNDYGYTIIDVINATHLHIAQHSVVKGVAFDEITLVKDVHGVYSKSSQSSSIFDHDDISIPNFNIASSIKCVNLWIWIMLWLNNAI